MFQRHAAFPTPAARCFEAAPAQLAPDERVVLISAITALRQSPAASASAAVLTEASLSSFGI